MTAFVICACYCLLATATYLIWPSKWNVVAHFQVAFCLVAYVVPVLILRQHELYSPALVDSFVEIMVLGTLVYVVALLVGSHLANTRSSVVLFRRAAALDELTQSKAPERIMFAMIVGIVLTLVAAVGMQGLPLFADDPYLAKYMRGPYAEPYARVAVFYKVGTALLTVIPPLAIAMIWQDPKRRAAWMWVSGVGVALMIASLQRGPMAEGVLMFLVVYLIFKRRYVLSAAVIVSTYVLGTLFYLVLSFIGWQRLASDEPRERFTIWETIASWVPDLTDTLSFYSAWVAQGSEQTGGKTMWGGLVPGQYDWNSAVWSLETLNYGQDVSMLGSGGLRIPVPLWGMVNAGTIGVVLLAAALGLIIGYMTKRVATVFPRPTIIGSVAWIAVLNAGMHTLGSLEAMSYLDFVKAAALLWVLWPCLRARGTDPADRKPGLGTSLTRAAPGN